jgi:hypothetical protein
MAGISVALVLSALGSAVPSGVEADEDALPGASLAGQLRPLAGLHPCCSQDAGGCRTTQTFVYPARVSGHGGVAHAPRHQHSGPRPAPGSPCRRLQRRLHPQKTSRASRDADARRGPGSSRQRRLSKWTVLSAGHSSMRWLPTTLGLVGRGGTRDLARRGRPRWTRGRTWPLLARGLLVPPQPQFLVYVVKRGAS